MKRNSRAVALAFSLLLGAGPGAAQPGPDGEPIALEKRSLSQAAARRIIAGANALR
jgi:hypothetical protein